VKSFLEDLLWLDILCNETKEGEGGRRKGKEEKEEEEEEEPKKFEKGINLSSWSINLSSWSINLWREKVEEPTGEMRWQRTCCLVFVVIVIGCVSSSYLANERKASSSSAASCSRAPVRPRDSRSAPTKLRVATFNAEWLFDGVDDENIPLPWRSPQAASSHIEAVAKVD